MSVMILKITSMPNALLIKRNTSMPRSVFNEDIIAKRICGDTNSILSYYFLDWMAQPCSRPSSRKVNKGADR